MADKQADSPALRLDTTCSVRSDKCSTCADILRDLLNIIDADGSTRPASATLYPVGEMGVDLYPDFPRLKRWAANGCALCQIFRAAALSPEASNTLGLRVFDGRPVLVQIHVKYSLTSKNKSEDHAGSKFLTSLGMSLCLSGFASPPLRVDQVWPRVSPAFYIHFPIVQSRALPYSDLMLGPLPEALPPSVLDEKPHHFIKRAIDKCVASCDHSLTPSQPDQQGFVPTRLVDVQQDILRVVSGADLARTQSAVRYATLSYCWGPAPQQLMLTRADESLLTTGFALDMLAPVQQDTVTLARALSIPYVWVDALCIRQGDRDDWVREASLMDRIYSRSFVTICAVASSGCHEGFLQRDDTTIPLPLLEDISPRDANMELAPRYALHGGMPSISKYGDTDLEHQLPHTPWARRAWTFQEDVLSSRCVYLTKSGIRFRCSGFVWAEGDNEQPRPPNSQSPPQFRHLVRQDFEQAPDVKWLRQAWAVAVYDFSSRQITQRGDFLPALSGLARRFAVAFGGSSDGGNSDEKLYAAGLWRPDLHRWLMWTLEYEQACPYQSLEDVLEYVHDSDTYIAPSWSWVGRRQAVNIATMSDRGIPEIDTDDNDDNVTIVARVADVVCEACTADGFGQIAASAMLMMETEVVCLGESNVTRVDLAHRPEAAQGKSSSATLTVDVSNDMPLEMHLDWEYTVAEGNETWKHLTLALIGYFTPEVVVKGQLVGGKCPYGLVLYRGAGGRPFARVGIFYVPLGKVRMSKVSWHHDAIFDRRRMETFKVI